MIGEAGVERPAGLGLDHHLAEAEGPLQAREAFGHAEEELDPHRGFLELQLVEDGEVAGEGSEFAHMMLLSDRSGEWPIRPAVKPIRRSC